MINPLQIYDKTYAQTKLDDNRAMLRQQAEDDLAALRSTKQSSATMTQPDIMNGKYAVTQNFGVSNPLEKFSGGVHYGTDFATPMNTPIALPQGNWTVSKVMQNDKGYGNSVLAVNDNTGEMMRFSHLNSLNANPGQKLQGNSVVGYSGSTGNSTGPHIDIEYYTKGGKPANILASSYANQLWQ